jgi:hypothetical protein
LKANDEARAMPCIPSIFCKSPRISRVLSVDRDAVDAHTAVDKGGFEPTEVDSDPA